MPSWKKVITSGSVAALSSLTVTNGITGSLFGTASWAVSSSNALTASFLTGSTNAFIQNGNSFGTQALLGTNDNQNLALETSGSIRMFISSSGDISINTTTPNARLDINGNTIITGSLTQGSGSIVSGIASHAEGRQVTASGNFSHAEGNRTSASGLYSHAEGTTTLAAQTAAHAEGESTQANGIGSHAEGNGAIAAGSYSHAEGFSTQANGYASHAEGGATIASGIYSHAEGDTTTASGLGSHAEGSGSIASGTYSHAEGNRTVASGSYQHVQGQFNISSSAQSAFIIGNGTSNASRSNLVFASGSIFEVTGSVIATQGFTGSLFGTSSWANNVTSASFAVSSSRAVTSSFSTNALTASNISPAITNNTDNYVLTANGDGTINGESLLQFDGQKLSVLYQSGDEGGEILLGKAATNTTLTGSGVTIDIWQNRLRFFEQGGAARGAYIDLTAAAAGVGTNLIATSGGGTVTQINTAGSVNGITLTGGPITTTGTVTLGGTLSNVQSSQLATSSLMIGTTNIALGATASSLTGLTSVNATSFTGSLFGTASWALNAVTASFVTTAQTASYVLQAVSSSFASTAQTASFVTGSNVYGPFGSNSIISASFAVSSSRAVSASFALTSSYSFNPTISGSISQVDYIDFNTGSATPAWKSGRVFWDNTDGALSVYNAEADITLQVGQENWTRVRNNTGTTITNGTAVRLSGAQGDVPTVQRAQSLAVSGSVNLQNQILGIATHDIEDSSFGYITTQGLVRGLNTNAFSDGDTLFVGTGSAGTLQNTAPRAPFEIIPVGVCVKASPGGSGIIYVAIQQPIDFSDLSSAKVEGTYSYGDLWTYERSGSVGVWRHTNQLSGSYGITGSISITGSLAIKATLIDYASVNPTVSGLNTIYTQATGSYTAAFMKYTVSSGSNTRAGEFMTTWNGTNIVYTDTSTTDIGNTAGLSFLSSIVSSQLRVSASCTAAGWNVKTLSTFI